MTSLAEALELKIDDNRDLQIFDLNDLEPTDLPPGLLVHYEGLAWLVIPTTGSGLLALELISFIDGEDQGGTIAKIHRPLASPDH